MGVLGGLGGEERPVPASRALEHGELLVRLAFAAVPPVEQLFGIVGIGVEPGDGQVLALLPALAGVDGLVPAGRAAGCGHGGALADQSVATFLVGS